MGKLVVIRETLANLVGYKKKVHTPPEEDWCPICLDSFQFPCQTNCGHWFGGECFLQLWNVKEIKHCKCPMCRSVVKKLIRCSSFLTPSSGDDGRELLKDIRAYNYINVRIWLAYFKGMIPTTMVRNVSRNVYEGLIRLTWREIILVLVVMIQFIILRFCSPPYWLVKIVHTSRLITGAFVSINIAYALGDKCRRYYAMVDEEIRTYRAMLDKHRARNEKRRARRARHRARLANTVNIMT